MNTTAQSKLNQVSLVEVPTWESLCQSAASFLNSPGDPFVPQTVITPPGGFGRALAQYLARQLGGPAGVCTGINFLTMSAWRRQLEADYLELDLENDLWRSQTALTLGINDLLHSCNDKAWFASLHAHLAKTNSTRPGRYLATAHRIARLFRRYLDRQPAMLAAWSQNQYVDPAGRLLASVDQWQPELWNLLVQHFDRIGQPDPIVRATRLVDAICLSTSDVEPALTCGVVSTLGLRPADWDLLDAIAQIGRVSVWQMAKIRPSSDAKVSNFASRYGVVERAAVQFATERLKERLVCQLPDKILNAADANSHSADSANQATSALTVSSPKKTLLAQVQFEIRNNQPAPLDPTRQADGSIQIHACHGPDRQVEVLRDVLCDLFESDPTLEPRDVVILCPKVSDYATLLAANFDRHVEPSPLLHPGHQLRVQLASKTYLSINPVIDVLTQVLQFDVSRAEAQSLIEIASAPPVAHKFGFTDDDLAQLTELIVDANIRWGIDAASRISFGLAGLSQGTWTFGLDQMLTGVTLSGSPGTWLDLATPLDRVSSTDLDLIGSLSELVSRIRKCLFDFQTPAPAQIWVERLREVIQLLVEVPQNESWQLDQTYAELTALASAAQDCSSQLTTADMRVLFAQLATCSQKQNTFFTGSLSVAELGELHDIEHRVVCILGLDDRHFPAKHRRDGDDLTVRPGNRLAPRFDERLASRQYLLDAILSARDNLIVITQGSDPRTNENLAAPIPILDLLEACALIGAGGVWRPSVNELTPAGTGAIVRHHTLQAYGWSNFIETPDAPVFSFDIPAELGAIASQTPPSASNPAWLWEYPGSADPVVSVDELIKFFQQPAATLLNLNAGLARTTYETEVSGSLPIELDSLAQYSVAQRLVEMLVTDLDPPRAAQVISLSGAVPPGHFGRRVVDSLLNKAVDLAEQVRAAISCPAAEISVELNLGEHLLVGNLRSHANSLFTWGYGRTKGSHLVASWISLLAATLACPEHQTSSTIIKRDATIKLNQPTQAVARDLLNQLLCLRDLGLRQVLPLPIETSAAFVGVLDTRRRFSATDRAKEAWKYESSGSWTHFFPDFEDLFVQPVAVDDPIGGKPEQPRFTALAHWLWTPIQKAIQPKTEMRWWK